jgi:uncharacterized damage-inducible protein DinB
MSEAGTSAETLKQAVRTEIHYSAWANRLVPDACAALTEEEFERDLGASHGSIGATLRHMYYAERVWLVRLRANVLPPLIEIGKQKLADPPPEPGLDALRAKWPEISGGFKEWIEALDDLDYELRFRMPDGTEFSLSRWKIVLHMANHSTLHRGQVTNMLRQMGRKPPQTDLFSFYLEPAG